jgi:hypothetical protein
MNVTRETTTPRDGARRHRDGASHHVEVSMNALYRSVIAAASIAALATACGAGGPDDDNDPDAGFTNPGGGDANQNPTNCTSDIVDSPTAPACVAATKTCIDACTTDDCPDNCLAMDPDPDNCGACLEDGWIACANAAGCQAEWDVMICCYEGCADPESAACETTCTPESNAYEACAEAHDETCAASTDAICYMP